MIIIALDYYHVTHVIKYFRPLLTHSYYRSCSYYTILQPVITKDDAEGYCSVTNVVHHHEESNSGPDPGCRF